jgi:tetratricopeptide (TPR) repeat protein
MDSAGDGSMNFALNQLLDSTTETPLDHRPALLKDSHQHTLRRAEVQSLLENTTDAESLFDAAVRHVASALRDQGRLSPDDRIGSYRIVSLIGQGGMGAVYLAERADGTFRQQVAMKLLQSGNAELFLERFWQERRILALLNHPNIARLLDAGQTSSGTPWFVMEYVPGQRIDEYCEKSNLAIDSRLELFLRVCDAVRYAHQSLIVHRDLKPANILVAENGEPKLLDFGIAKVLDPANLNSASTGLLTPEYASPEQIRGDAITTATDIYSLGAVLYKMLSGQPPHPLSELAPLDAAWIITEEEVPPVSSVRPGLAGDIDSILQKALHKEPSRRYQSVQEFAQDIRYYLQGRPVLARPDHFGYRASRFLRRNAFMVTVSALAALFLIVGTFVSIHQARRAQHRFQQVRQLANVFLFDFERSLENVPGALDARKLVAATARQYLEQLAAESAGDTGLQREIAVAYERLSDIQHDLLSSGGTDAEIESLRTAYEIRRRLGDDRSDNATHRKEFIDLASHLAARYQTTRKASESVKWDEEATGLATRWVNSEPKRREALEAAGTAFMNQGLRLEIAGQADRACHSMEKAVRFAERAREVAGDQSGDYGLAHTEYTFANMLLNLKRPAEALMHAQRAVALMEPLHRMAPRNQKWSRGYQQSLSSAGIACRALAKVDRRRLPDAVQFLDRAHTLAFEAAQEDPKNAQAKDDLVVQCHRLARALIQSGKADLAATLYDEAGKAVREMIAGNPKNRRYWYLSAANQVLYGDLLLEQGQAEQAKNVLLSADVPFERALAFDPLDATLLELRASQLQMLAETMEKLGDREAARLRTGQCVDVLKALIDRDPSAKDYIGDYKAMITLARRLGVSTRNLPPS